MWTRIIAISAIIIACIASIIILLQLDKYTPPLLLPLFLWIVIIWFVINTICKLIIMITLTRSDILEGDIDGAIEGDSVGKVDVFVLLFVGT